jgi:hypothetical protein
VRPFYSQLSESLEEPWTGYSRESSRHATNSRVKSYFGCRLKKKLNFLSPSTFNHADKVRVWLPYFERLLRDSKDCDHECAQLSRMGYEKEAVGAALRKRSAVEAVSNWLASRRPRPADALTLRNAFSKVYGARRLRGAGSSEKFKVALKESFTKFFANNLRCIRMPFVAVCERVGTNFERMELGMIKKSMTKRLLRQIVGMHRGVAGRETQMPRPEMLSNTGFLQNICILRTKKKKKLRCAI